MSRLARINVGPGGTTQQKTCRSCAASCRIYCALTKPPRSASRTSGSRPDSMNTIGLECLECRALDAIALPHGLCTIDGSGKVIIANRRTAELFGATVEMLKLNVPLPEFIGH